MDNDVGVGKCCTNRSDWANELDDFYKGLKKYEIKPPVLQQHKYGGALYKAQNGLDLASNCTTGNCTDPETDRRNRYTSERRLADSSSLAS